MTATMCSMETPQEFGRRVKLAREGKVWSVVKAAAEAGISRDTWTKIEAGKSSQDAKRGAVASALGIPIEPEAAPLTWDDMGRLGPRLSGIDRQLDALWRRVDELQQQIEREEGDPGARSASAIGAVTEREKEIEQQVLEDVAERHAKEAGEGKSAAPRSRRKRKEPSAETDETA